MGLDIRTAEFLLHCRGLGVDFSEVCTLGHQTVMLSPFEAKRLSRWLHLEEPVRDTYADFFFKTLGATTPHALDASAYQGADIVHNLNAELPRELQGRFSCLIDGGTLEHIFDFPKALSSCMQMVRPGGHLVICQMANNCMGHGFYQFSPEVFYSAFTSEHGYELRLVALNEGGTWYEALSPKQVGDRIQARTREETFIYVVARRIAEVVPFRSPPHQSDYESNLGESETATGSHASAQGMAARLKDHARALKRSLFPCISDWQFRYNRYRHTRLDRLSNRKRFRKIGKRLLNSAAALGCLVHVYALALFEPLSSAMRSV